MGWRGRIALSTTAILLALFAFGSSGHAQSETVINIFEKEGPPGNFPNGVIANNGILFGTNAVGGGPNGVGNVFELRPPATPGGPWSKAVLYDFQFGVDGQTPQGLLLAGANHVLYGVTGGGGDSGEGTVFALQPPAGGGTPWIETPLYSFGGPPSDGAGPSDGLIADPNGTLYGATTFGGSATACCDCPGPVPGCGAVFSLTPPSTPGGAWTENVLYSFSGGSDGSEPVGGLVLSQNGVLYGVTLLGGAAGYGVVYALTPPTAPGGAWVETTVYSFQNLLDGGTPRGPLVAYKNGDLVGTCRDGGQQALGTAFALTPPSTPGGPWTEHTLWSFGVVPGDGVAPVAGLTLVDGLLYGVTFEGGAYGDGTVFQLTPPAALGIPWTETILHSFNPSSATLDGSNPSSRLSLGPSGALYGSTSGSSAGLFDGTVYEVTP